MEIKIILYETSFLLIPVMGRKSS